MERKALEDVSPGMRLARPARTQTGEVVLTAGVSLSQAQLKHLSQLGIAELLVVGPNEAIPEPSVPEYMDRYEANFASELQAVFKDSMCTRTMQELFLRALGHASTCYRNYRLDEDQK